MIYVTGDTHGDFRRFTSHNFPEQSEMTKDDYVVICGDFGGVWGRYAESCQERYWLDWLNEKPFTTLFVDGNHENYDRLLEYPEKSWNGGQVNEVRSSILHLKRGYVFNIQDKQCFTFGGARSHDIDGGVFEIDDPDRDFKERFARSQNKYFRINHLSWWKEEEPNQDELDLGLKNLEQANWKVDFVFTHDCPSSILAQLYRDQESYELTNYLEQICQKLDYKWWFFGHHHIDRIFGDAACLYYQITRIC